MSYILVNPKLSNSNISSKKANSIDAAEDVWSKLSANIENYTPKFYFTLQKAGSGELSHYVVRESIEGEKGDEKVKMSVKRFNGKLIDEKSFLDELKQEGGKHKHRHDDDSSSSSSSSSIVFTFPAGTSEKNLLTLTYYPTIYGVPNVLFPTFSPTFAPFTNIRVLPNVLITYP